MKTDKYCLQFVFSFIGAALSAFFGGFDSLLKALVVFAFVDYISGVTAAVINKRLDSATGFNGILKKIFMFALVGVGHIIDTLILGQGSVIRSAVIFFYLSNEGISMLENICQTGLPVPEKLKNILNKLKKEDENEAK